MNKILVKATMIEFLLIMFINRWILPCFLLVSFFISTLLYPQQNQSKNQSKKSIQSKAKAAGLLSKAFRYYYQGKDSEAVRYFNEYIAIQGSSAAAERYLGIIYFRKGNLDKAVDYLEKAAKSDPSDSNSLQILGQIHLNLNKFEKAKFYYEKILQIDPLDISAIDTLALIHEKQGNTPKSVYYYKRLLLSSQTKFNTQGAYHALQNLGRYYYEQQDYKKAIDYYSQLQKLDSDNFHYAYALGNLYKFESQIEESIRQYVYALKIKPQHRISRHELVENYYRIGHPKARSETKKFIDDFKPVSHLIKGIYAELTGDLKAAENYFRLVIQAHPDLLSAYLGISKVYTKLNDQENLKKELFIIIYLAQKMNAFKLARQYAIVLLKLLDEQSKEIGFEQTLLSTSKKKVTKLLEQEMKALIKSYIDIYSAHAYTMNQIKQPRIATVYYKKSLLYLNYFKNWLNEDKTLQKQIAQKEYELLLNLSWAFYRKPMSQFSESIEVLKKAVRLFPENPRGHFLMGYTYYHWAEKKMEYYQTAIDSMKKAIQFTSKENAPGNYFFYLAASLEKSQRFNEAEKFFKKAISLEPENSSYLNYLGYLYSLKEIKYSEAKQLLLRALEGDPGNASYLDSLGWLFYKNGQYNEALAQLLMAVNQSVKADYTDAVLYYHLAEVYYKLKKYSLASIYFTKALETKTLSSEKINEVTIKKRLDFLKKQKKP